MTQSNTLDFAAFAKRAEAGERLTVTFFGGSLTWGAQATDPLKTSYRALIGKKMQERYPEAHFTFVDAAIGGTGSQLGAFRLQRDVLAHEPDLVFLDFTVNDGASKIPEDDRLSSYESIIRRMVSAGIPVVQMLLAVKVDVEKVTDRPLDALHREIGEAYGLPVGDAVAVMRAAVNSGEVTPEELWDLPYDSTHPGDAGYALYAKAAWGAYSSAVEEKRICQVPEAMVHTDRYMRIDRFPLCTLENLPEGWSRGVPRRDAIAFDFICSRWMDDLAIASSKEGKAPQPLMLSFVGESILLFGEGTQRSGSFEIRIDEGEPQEYPTVCAGGSMRYLQIVAMDLKPDVAHTISILPKLKGDEELRLESVCIAGGQVLVDG
ncbi:SGNH/GDSL hydrolase family protein [Puniceicoccus vermicola]|uniref:SGNH/GDSL hydrolase family protein n=1 Tax=Puniceicoccus vermicola TaxID=388746 RepID=A0A7X1AZB3_9BACT|nr:SGNH/GDSL hydrolase family protein [Puniceicoccus vermicola]MBC2602738.1 SGNH/GDSL hydrolase family protein [Puniceicoccus vermicola]